MVEIGQTKSLNYLLRENYILKKIVLENTLYLRCSLRLSKNVSFSFRFQQVKHNETDVMVREGSAQSCLHQTRMGNNWPDLSLSFQDHYIQKQLSSMLMSALDENVKVDLKIILQTTLVLLDFNLTFDLIQVLLFDLKQTSLDVLVQILRSILRFVSLVSIRSFQHYSIVLSVLNSILLNLI